MVIRVDQLFDLSSIRDQQELFRITTTLNRIANTSEGQELFAQIQQRHPGRRIPIELTEGITSAGNVVAINPRDITDSAFGGTAGDWVPNTYDGILFHELVHMTQSRDEIIAARQAMHERWAQGLQQSSPAVYAELQRHGIAGLEQMETIYLRGSSYAPVNLSFEARAAIGEYSRIRATQDPSELEAIRRTNQFMFTYYGADMRVEDHNIATAEYRTIDRLIEENPIIGEDHLYDEMANIALNSPELRNVIVNARGWNEQFDRNGNGRMDDNEIVQAARALDRNNNGVFDYSDYASIANQADPSGNTTYVYSGNGNLMENLCDSLQNLPRGDRTGHER